MPTIGDLRQRQSLPLGAKVAMTQVRIKEWYNHFWGDVYVSFSGGKDSTVLLHLVRDLYPDVEAVFVDTGLEYPEIQKFVKRHANVTIVRPKMRFDEVIRKYGYPVISKDIAGAIGEVRNPNYHGTARLKKINGELMLNGKKSPYNCDKYKDLLNADFMISSLCCDVMKKAPAKSFEHKQKKTPITAQMAEESRLRTSNWLKSGCNAFENKRPISNPISFWTEQDVLQYIKENNIEICSVYGQIVQEGGQLPLDGFDCKLCTTGYKRTGCIFCGFGCHLEKGETRFQRLKRTHPKQYDYCIGGGAYDPEDGLWKPDKNGLGMAHVFDELNKLYGENFIRYK